MFFYATLYSHVASFMKIFNYWLLAFCCTIIFRRDDGAASIESSSHPPSFIQTRSGVVAILTHGSPSVHVHHLKILHLHPLGCMGFILFKGSNSPRLKRFYLHGVWEYKQERRFMSVTVTKLSKTLLIFKYKIDA